MSKILSEFSYYVKSKAGFLFVLCFLNILVVAGVVFASNLVQMEQKIKKEYQMVFDEWNYYNTGDLFIEEGESFFNDKNWLDKLKSYNQKLHDTIEFNYLEIYDQPIYCNEYKKEEFLQYYTHDEALSKKAQPIQKKDGTIENFYCLKAMWLGAEVFHQFNIQVKEGRLFQIEDFEYQYGNDSVVILGAEYGEFYQVGDVITFCFPFGAIDFKAKVIGILPSGCNITRGGRFVNLDRDIILPQFIMKQYPSNDREQRFQQCLYLNKNCGVIASKIGANAVQHRIDNYNYELGISPGYYVAGATKQQSMILKTSLAQVVEYTLQIVLLLLLITSVITVIYSCIKINKSKSYFAILLLNGYTYHEVFLILSLEIITIYFVALLIGLPLGMILSLACTIPMSNCFILFILVPLLCMVIISIMYQKFYSLSIMELLRK